MGAPSWAVPKLIIAIPNQKPSRYTEARGFKEHFNAELQGAGSTTGRFKPRDGRVGLENWKFGRVNKIFVGKVGNLEIRKKNMGVFFVGF